MTDEGKGKGMVFKDNRVRRGIGLIAGLAAVVVVVAYFPGVRSCGTDGPPAEPTERTFEFTIGNGKVPEDRRVIRVWKDDTVRLHWTTDAPVVLHLHGYDIEKRVMPGRKTEIDFKAHATGRFPVNVHREDQGKGAVHDEAPLVTVEVHPR